MENGKKEKKTARGEERERLLNAQQGELDAVLMYEALAKAVAKKNPEDAEVFLQLAAEEGRHAAVFRKLTGTALTPVKLKAFAVPKLYRLIGRRRLYMIIADAEYAAENGYMPLAETYPEMESVKADEKHHGDMVMALLDETAEESPDSETEKGITAEGAGEEACPLKNYPAVKSVLLGAAVVAAAALGYAAVSFVLNKRQDS